MPNNQPKLMKISYFDSKAESRIYAYADTVVLDRRGGQCSLAAIRFGGYPESVRGMSDAIYGGGAITVETGGWPDASRPAHPCGPDGSLYVTTAAKQYGRESSHDGIYAEATLIIRDEEQKTFIADEGGKPKIRHGARKCYLFCEHGDNNRLFEELDKKTSVPLIPDFRGYLLNELEARNILRRLDTISRKENFDAWILELSEDESNVIEAVCDGLKSGAISIPGGRTSADGKSPFDEINSVTQYLNAYGVTVAERIKGQFRPLFDPASESLSPEILAVNENIRKTAGYSLYGAQLAVAEAMRRRLNRGKAALCIAECGAGKTKIGLAALCAHQRKDEGKHHGGKHFNAVICPSHMTKKWAREIEETLPDTFALIVANISELNKVYEAYERGNKTCYIIMSKEKARDGYMKRPAVTWNRRERAFICPDCHGAVMTEVIDCGAKYRVTADQFFFQRENRRNHKCENCGAALWTVLSPGRRSEWVKVSEHGFVHRRFAHQHLEHVKNAAAKAAIEEIAADPDGDFHNAGAYNRFPLSTYIRQKMKGKLDGLIIDELHNYNNNSGQGDAMCELFGAAKKVVGLTATLINGYSSGIFYLLFRIAPSLMLQDDKQYDKPNEFNAEYGVTESVYELKAADYNSNRRTVRRKIRERQLPGVSPLVYSRFLMDSAAFLSLNDMGKDLPEYEEIPVQLRMNEDVGDEYRRIEERFRSILRGQKDISRKILSSYLWLLTEYPDQPYDHEPIVHPVTGEELVAPVDTSSFGELHEKDENVLAVVKEKAAKGERVLIYTSWIRIDTQQKLLNLLTENGFRVSVLTSAVPPNRREEWVEKQVGSGIQVMITNPSLVETGLDLNDFTTLYYYNISYNLFTLRQSSRRSWRINQTAPRIEVYFTYYEGTMQHRAIRLMASKLAVAGIIEGSFSDEGLAAMSDCQDMTTALARELTMGIKNEVEDLGAVFKKMAVLKPIRETDGLMSEEKADIGEQKNPQPASVFELDSVPQFRDSPDDPVSLFSSETLFLEYTGVTKTQKAKTIKKKSIYADENQLSLFEMFDCEAV